MLFIFLVNISLGYHYARQESVELIDGGVCRIPGDVCPLNAIEVIPLLINYSTFIF